MRRVASLYLPLLPTERLQRPARLPTSLKAAQLPVDDDPGACSVPRGGGWRPGARWAQGASTRSNVQAEVDALPVHQRPPLRELGRRSEAAPHPYRALRSDDGNAMHPHIGAPPAVPLAPPLVLSMPSGQRDILYAVCGLGRELGLVPGMALTQARVLVADLDVRPADAASDLALLHRFLVHALRQWTPVAAVSDPDGLWLDLHGTAHLFGGEARFCRKVVGFFARLGFTARMAVADTSGAAHALARHGDEHVVIVPRGGTIEAIAGLPIMSLRLSNDAVGAAHRFGFERVADLLAVPRAPLARRLGLAALARLDQAIGREVEAIVPATLTETPVIERRLVEPIATPDAIGHLIALVVEAMTALLHARDLGARRLALTLRRVDAVDQHIVIGTARATRDAKHLARLFRLKIDTIEPGLGIEAASLTAVRFEPLFASQLATSLLGSDAITDLAPLIDQLGGRVGPRAVFRLAPVESDVPERAVRRVGPLRTSGEWPHWRRPARLLSWPEPLANVVALLPDHPPRRFSWRGVSHVVMAGDGPERIHGEWWVRDGEIWAVRDYFRVEDECGRHYWLFRRGDGVEAATGDLSWYIHGVG